MMWISALLIGLGIPSISPFLSVIASLGGLLPLLYSNLDRPFKQRFYRTFLVFTLIYAIQLSWFLSHPFLYIYPAWILLSAFLALLISLPLALHWGVWSALGVVIVEYIRLHILCGFSFYPLGISLTAFTQSRLFLTYLGMSGLSFLFVVGQILLVRYLHTRKGLILLLIILALPYISYAPEPTSKGKLTVGIIDTNYLPDMVENPGPLIKSAQDHIERLIYLTLEAKKQNVDLLVVPEIYVPFSPNAVFYSNLSTMEVLQNLSNTTGITYVIGLEGRDPDNCYNSAYCIQPRTPVQRYDKQVLVPLGEYVPFSFLESFLDQYGIGGGFSHGQTPTLFHFKNLKLAPSICFEETFPNIIRRQKILGADLLINLSNDNWFPNSRLKEDHFEHARVVSVELGTMLIRACNMGKSAIVDINGNLIPLTIVAEKDQTKLLTAQIEVQTRTTFYENLGAKKALAIISLFCLLVYMLGRQAWSQKF